MLSLQTGKRTSYRRRVIEVPDYMKHLAERGLSLGEFAAAVGYSKTYVAEVLSGKREVPEETEKKILAGFEICQWCKNKWPHPSPKVVRTKRRREKHTA